MRVRPRDGTKSLRTGYEQILQNSLDLQRRYNVLLEETNDSHFNGRMGEAEGLAKRRSELRRGLDDDLTHRVEILRRLESLKTLEHAQSAEKLATEDEKRRLAAAAVAVVLGTDDGSLSESKVVGAQVEPKETAVNDAVREFAKVREALAREYQYEVTTEESGWFSLRRSGLQFSMKHFLVPSPLGIGNESRISKIVVSGSKGSDQVTYLRYDDGWETACTDPSVQREIDRVIAIFG